MNHLFISMNIQSLSTLHHICKAERTQMLNLFANSDQNHRPAGYLLTGNCLIFLLV